MIQIQPYDPHFIHVGRLRPARLHDELHHCFPQTPYPTSPRLPYQRYFRHIHKQACIQHRSPHFVLCSCYAYYLSHDMNVWQGHEQDANARQYRIEQKILAQLLLATRYLIVYLWQDVSCLALASKSTLQLSFLFWTTLVHFLLNCVLQSTLYM